MLYKSTRGSTEVVNSNEAILKGLCDDGGLFVPVKFPEVQLPLSKMINFSYKETASYIFQIFFDEFSVEEINKIVDDSYDNKFSVNDMVNLTKADDAFFIELYHGPTSAFKDMALSALPHLMTESGKKISLDKELVILTATSGDTGKAALEGFSDVEGTKIVVFYPEKGVSNMQKLQMTTQEGKNVKVFGIKGNFDDAQRAVKTIFTDSALRKEMNEKGRIFSSANSINIGRLIPQVVYYVYSYLQLVKKHEINLNDKINIVVPCGNFGNILASYYSMKLGIPVNKFICASNKNNVLTDFFKTGFYDAKREMYTTVSPSMDILVSSNLERYIYEISGENETFVKDSMDSLQKYGHFELTDKFKKSLDKFYAGFCSDSDTLKAINEMYESHNYLIDTHTAVAYKVYKDYVAETSDNTKTLIASTASPYKFSESVLTSLNLNQEDLTPFEMMDKLYKNTNVKIPQNLCNLKNKKIIHDEVIDKSTIITNLKKYLESGEQDD